MIGRPVGRPITTIEEMLTEHIGPMAKFVVKKQMESAGVDISSPTTQSLNRMVELIEERCLMNVVSSEDAKKIAAKMREVIASTPIETIPPEKEQAVENLDAEIVAYLSQVFGEVSQSAIEIQKKKMGLGEHPTLEEYQKLAERIREVFVEMADEAVADIVYHGILAIIKEHERQIS